MMGSRLLNHLKMTNRLAGEVALKLHRNCTGTAPELHQNRTGTARDK